MSKLSEILDTDDFFNIMAVLVFVAVVGAFSIGQDPGIR